jgi:putative SOS response-associated peptidase YedK
MCGRFTLVAPGDAIADLFHIAVTPDIPTSYNIAPTDYIVAVRISPENKERELVTNFHWGLIPFWAKDSKIGSKMINARSETAAEKPSFRSAMRYRRCLVPADGFYEWQKIDGRKQPVRIQRKDGGVFAMAGLWERWKKPDGGEKESCTLLTTEPNDLLAQVHNRMPVILSPDDFDLWLDASVQNADAVQHLLRPYPGEDMRYYPVSTYVNNPRNDDPLCIEPLTD